MRAFLIDPYIKRIEEVDVPDELAVFKDLIGCHDLNCSPWRIDSEKLALWVDDEGIRSERPSWLRTSIVSSKAGRQTVTLGPFVLEPSSEEFHFGRDAIYGRGLVLGVTPNGVHRDPKIDILRLSEFVFWEC